MKKKVIVLVIALIAFANTVFALEHENIVIPVIGEEKVSTSSDDITVILNGEVLNFDIPPEIVKGRVMIPLRTILEAVGLKVDWDRESQQIIGTKDELTVKLAVGKSGAYINNKYVILDSIPIEKNGRTLVPVRFIAEATGLNVKWNPKTSTINIKEPIEIIVQQKDNTEFISGYYEEDYIKLSSNGTTLKVSGKLKNKRGWNLVFYDKEGVRALETDRETVRKGGFDTSVDLSKLKGNYKLTVYVGEELRGTFWNFYSDIPITVKNGKITFDTPPTYESNHEMAVKASHLDPEDYLGLDHINESERKVIVDLAERITAGKTSNYDKLLAIHDWMTNNIYYNRDGYYSGNYGKTDAYGTYDSKRSVCQGYAELTVALGRAVGIPTRLVSGYALGISTSKTWDEKNLKASSNHAWNEAFIDNRWIILDTTWDTFNKYEGGKFREGDKRYRYFDISLEYLSETHRIMR